MRIQNPPSFVSMFVYLTAVESILGSPVKTVNIGVPAKIELKEEFERYFKENEGLGPLAKQVCSLHICR